MRFFSIFQRHDINEGIREYSQMPGALLLDVRTPQEYSAGHIPGSKNLPLQDIDKAEAIADNRNIPMFVYCHSGVRSGQAVELLQDMGYANVKNLGGIAAYAGKVEY